MCVDGGPNFGQIGWSFDQPRCKGRQITAADIGPQQPEEKEEEKKPEEVIDEPF